MSEQLKESMSAVMDDEADAFELRRVLDEASANEDLREQWHRMHMVRDVLRAGSQASVPGGATELAESDVLALRARVQAALREPVDAEQADEPLAVVPAAKSGGAAVSNWRGRLTGTAVALVVAAIVVVNGDLLVGDAPEVAQVATPEFTTLQPAAVGPGSIATREAAMRRLDALRMLHYQTTAVNRPGAVSFVRMATFGRSQPVRPAAVTDTAENR